MPASQHDDDADDDDDDDGDHQDDGDDDDDGNDGDDDNNGNDGDDDIFSPALPLPMITQSAWSAFPVKERIHQQYNSLIHIHGSMDCEDHDAKMQIPKHL